ncbi:MAG: hypothetical protein WC680_06965 [Sulfuricurvum sp.]|jgi:hypothetical protein
MGIIDKITFYVNGSKAKMMLRERKENFGDNKANKKGRKTNEKASFPDSPL